MQAVNYVLIVVINQVKLKTYLVELIYICPVCGMIMDRDINASKNLLKLAI